MATRNSSVATRYGELRAEIATWLDGLRSLMAGTAPYGFQERVCELMEWRKQRISRELNRVEKLSIEAFKAEVLLHREEGRPELADQLMAAFHEGQPIKLKTSGAVVIRITDGQMFLDLQS